MGRSELPRAGRRGNVVVICALGFTTILGMSAIALDLSYLQLVCNELQFATDAAALAGAARLASGPTAVRRSAAMVAGMNTAGGDAVLLSDAQIEIGVWSSASGSFTAYSGAAESAGDAVRVTGRRAGMHGFLAAALGWAVPTVARVAIAGNSTTTRCGLLAKTSAGMSGSFIVNSYDSTAGTYSAVTATDDAGVCSDGNISLSGGASIHGDAAAGPDAGDVLSMTGSSYVTGSTAPLQANLAFPAVDFTSASPNDNATIPRSILNKVAVDGSNALVLSGSDGLNLPPGTYHFHAINISGSAWVRITGPTTIYVDTKSVVSGGGLVNTTANPHNLALLTNGATVTYSGSANFYGSIDAPSATVTVSGGAQFFGNVVGSSITMSGGGVHIDTSLALTRADGARAPHILL